MNTLAGGRAKAVAPQLIELEHPRLAYLDHLRAALVGLVVLHHIALIYGAGAPFYYVEPPFGDSRAFTALLVFVLFNQAWFMGALFLLAGYFTPGSFDRKGAGSFLTGRALRLGVPMLIYAFVLNPVAGLGTYLMPEDLTGITDDPTWGDYPDLIGLGPLWFVAMLLGLTIAYAGWRRLSSRAGGPVAAQPLGYGRVCLFVVALAGAGYAMRMVVPLGESVWEFPTLAYLPQYVGLFVVGIVAYRRHWMVTLPSSRGVVGFAAAVVASVFLFPLAFSGRMFTLEVTEALDNAMGEGHWQSAVYAGWDAIFVVGMVLGAVVFFRKFLGARTRLGVFASRQSYAVYLIHTPIVVYLAYVLRNVEMASLPKFGLVSVVGVPVCFGVAWVIRRVPGVHRVL